MRRFYSEPLIERLAYTTGRALGYLSVYSLIACLTCFGLGCCGDPTPKQIAYMPVSLIGKMKIAEMRLGDHGFTEPMSLAVGKQRAISIDVEASLSKTARMWLTQKTPYLEIFNADNGWHVVLHGEHLWELTEVADRNASACKVLPAIVYKTVAHFHKSRTFEPLWLEDFPASLREAHDRRAFMDVQSRADQQEKSEGKPPCLPAIKLTRSE